MKLLYKPLDILMNFDENSIIELVIEDRDYFAKTLFELYEAFENAGDQWICSNDNKVISFDKNAYAINDYYFMINPSKSRTVTAALQKQITACAQSPEQIERTQEVLALVERYALELIDELGFDFEVSVDSFDMGALVKALGPKIYLNSNDLVARILEFCDVLEILTDINLFVLVNPTTLMGTNNLTSLTRELIYHGHQVLLLSSIESEIDISQKIIVNKDLAVL